MGSDYCDHVIDYIETTSLTWLFCFLASDEELFEDNPEEYIRRDIEGSDVDTRRRAACDLVKVLSKFFEEKMMTIFGQYVQVCSFFTLKERLILTNAALSLLFAHSLYM